MTIQKKLIQDDAIRNVALWPKEEAVELSRALADMRKFLSDNSGGYVSVERIEFCHNGAVEKTHGPQIVLTIGSIACMAVGGKMVWLQNATVDYIVNASEPILPQLETVIEQHRALRREFQRIETRLDAERILAAENKPAT